ncbi:MAG: hypothetical protein D6688_04330 [Alphaproteobacteria bacterium]|nr:MAG: hypothetical protein D6688_04330 [Alphaproteobacteria bacterium]
MWGGGGWLMFLVFAVLVIVPFWRLLPRFGIPAWVAIFAIFPLVALILLWIMAFRDEAGPRGN